MEVISRKEAIEKGLKMYFTGKPCKYGHIAERRVGNGLCLECSKKLNKEYYEQNKEQIKEYGRKYYEQNREQAKKHREQKKGYIKEYSKEYYEKNKEQIKEHRKQNREYLREYLREYREQNKEQYKEYVKEYRRNRYTSDENYKTSVICRRMLYRALNATSSTKDSRTYELLGYCKEQLKDSIESKFLEGMSWGNYGDWHVDHATPVARFIKDGVEDPAIINALDNLIPMWAEHNREKNERTLEEYLDDRRDLAELYGRFL